MVNRLFAFAAAALPSSKRLSIGCQVLRRMPAGSASTALAAELVPKTALEGWGSAAGVGSRCYWRLFRQAVPSSEPRE